MYRLLRWVDALAPHALAVAGAVPPAPSAVVRRCMAGPSLVCPSASPTPTWTRTGCPLAWHGQAWRRVLVLWRARGRWTAAKKRTHHLRKMPIRIGCGAVLGAARKCEAQPDRNPAHTSACLLFSSPSVLLLLVPHSRFPTLAFTTILHLSLFLPCLHHPLALHSGYNTIFRHIHPFTLFSYPGQSSAPAPECPLRDAALPPSWRFEDEILQQLPSTATVQPRTRRVIRRRFDRRGIVKIPVAYLFFAAAPTRLACPSGLLRRPS